MNEIDEIAVLLAERVAPDEVDVAPAIAHAIVEQGGRLGRRNSSAAVLGGFDIGGTISVVATVISAIHALTELVDRLLKYRSSRATGDAVPDPPGFEEAVATVAERLRDLGLVPDQADEVGRQTLLTLLEVPDKALSFIEALGAKQK